MTELNKQWRGKKADAAVCGALPSTIISTLIKVTRYLSEASRLTEDQYPDGPSHNAANLHSEASFVEGEMSLSNASITHKSHAKILLTWKKVYVQHVQI